MSKKDKHSESKKNGDIINILDSALDEDISEISEMSEVEESTSEAAKSGSKSAFHFIVGLIFIVLAAIGLVSTVSFVSGKVKNIIDNTDQKNEFAKFVVFYFSRKIIVYILKYRHETRLFF